MRAKGATVLSAKRLAGLRLQSLLHVRPAEESDVGIGANESYLNARRQGEQPWTREMTTFLRSTKRRTLKQSAAGGIKTPQAVCRPTVASPALSGVIGNVRSHIDR